MQRPTARQLVQLADLAATPLASLKIIEPPVARRSWFCSRLIVLPDRTTIPVLWHLAIRRYGPWNPATHAPIWADKDFRNETPDNVRLIELGSMRQRRLNISAPAGTKEYWREYSQLNREKQREYQRHYREKLRTFRKDLADPDLAALLRKLNPQ